MVSRTELFADHFVRRDWMASYDVHPNGDGFLFSETVEDSEPHPVMGDRGLSELVVVTNWLEELKAKVGNQ